MGAGLGDGGIDPALGSVPVPQGGEDGVEGVALKAGDGVGPFAVVGVLDLVEEFGRGAAWSCVYSFRYLGRAAQA